MSTDGGSQLESLWNAAACAVSNAIDAYAWIIPALFLTALLLVVIGLIAWAMEDIPFNLEIFQGIGGIFRWARRHWGPEENSEPHS